MKQVYISLDYKPKAGDLIGANLTGAGSPLYVTTIGKLCVGLSIVKNGLGDRRILLNAGVVAWKMWSAGSAVFAGGMTFLVAVVADIGRLVVWLPRDLLDSGNELLSGGSVGDLPIGFSRNYLEDGRILRNASLDD
ncbi:hypothetical protein K469DRAFT_701573 [Zopfia rhizophila CBS 207.26]|uniref:Uncharacterized protein n=1 Tax=Zopfia rhizophila CBS 207.26 TaxID=1314779 RepID=A0A6A6DAZ0_9PEZI|nr:hypothetical protein K469DRAFT_701573 [Zopfia rhizophila CBS 207.26]